MPNIERDINEYPITDEELNRYTKSFNSFNNDLKSKKNRTELCSVIQSTIKGKTGIEFKGYGVQISTKNSYSVGDKIKVEYKGEINSPNFKIVSEE